MSMANEKDTTAALWESWQRLHRIYSTLAREMVIDCTPCASLEDGTQVPSAEAVAEAEQWFATMDERVRIHHLRQFAQTSDQVNEQVLADLIFHLVNKKKRTEDDRDKADFTAVQLLSFRVPSRLALTQFSVEEAVAILEPVLGSGGSEDSKLMTELDGLLAEASGASNLNALFTARIIERSRTIKAVFGDRLFEPLTLAAIARFGFLLRRSFFRLMQQDLNAILDGLRQLENQGVTTLDCRKAQFGAEETIPRIRMICQSWRVMFQAEYSAGQPLCLLVDLKTAVETALAQSGKPEGASQTKGAQAGGKKS
jgi:hypothetical protein